MKSAPLQALTLSLSVAAWALAWFWIRPFDIVSAGLDYGFGAPPLWTQVKNLYSNPDTQETTEGRHPLESLDHLGAIWDHKSPRVLFLGNSQMERISLAQGERPSPQPEPTWVDLVTRELRMRNRIQAYRLAAVGMTYDEALWYTTYLINNPKLKPDVLFLQLNYQFMWENGIRESMGELLADSSFRARIKEEAASGKAYAATFSHVVQIWQKKQTLNASAEGGNTLHPTGPGAQIEAVIRRRLDASPEYADRSTQRDSFFNMLYRLRIYFLRIRPSTARSISTSRLSESQAAVNEIAKLCRDAGVRLAPIRVPVNPTIVLYGRPEDRRSYEGFLAQFRKRFDFPVYDFEGSIPVQDWGKWFNGPEPLHLSRAGHTLMAAKMAPVIDKELTRH